MASGKELSDKKPIFPAGHPASGKDLAGTPHPKKVKK